MKRLLISIIMVGAFAVGARAEAPELLYAVCNGPDGPIASISVVKEGLKFNLVGQAPLTITFEQVRLLEKTMEETSK